MGLTINYTLSIEKNLSSPVVRELVQRTGLYARKIGCAEVSKIIHADADSDFARLVVSVRSGADRFIYSIPPKRGWLVEVWPGEGCESATFGLCKYPCRFLSRAGWESTGFEDGWLLKGCCKTQYACEHGWPHFLRCHKTIVSILDFWRQLGVEVEAQDEGGYRETRSEKKLRAAVDRYDGLVAAFAGAFKDAADENGKSHSVESPIFARRDFERLEAEGWREFGGCMNTKRPT